MVENIRTQQQLSSTRSSSTTYVVGFQSLYPFYYSVPQRFYPLQLVFSPQPLIIPCFPKPLEISLFVCLTQDLFRRKIYLHCSLKSVKSSLSLQSNLDIAENPGTIVMSSESSFYVILSTHLYSMIKNESPAFSPVVAVQSIFYAILISHARADPSSFPNK